MKDRPTAESSSPPAETAATAATGDRATTVGGGQEASGRQKAGGGREKSDDGKEGRAATKRSTAGRRPTEGQIRAARMSQSEQQVDDLSPRLRRIREMAIARQLHPQKPLKLSPEEQRAFDIGKKNPQYQSIP